MSDQTARDMIAGTSDIHPSVLIPEAREWARTSARTVDREFIVALADALEGSVVENERLRGMIAGSVSAQKSMLAKAVQP